MAQTFVSPQTGSEYIIVNTEPTIFVAYRCLGAGRYRVRIQGPVGDLERIKKYLPPAWGEVKDGDHLSITVDGALNLANAVGDAVRALTFCREGDVAQ